VGVVTADQSSTGPRAAGRDGNSNDVSNAVNLMPLEALRELLQHFEEVSRRLAAEPNAPASASEEHRKWQALNATLAVGGEQALPLVRKGVRAALGAPSVQKPQPFEGRRLLRLCMVGFGLWSAFVLYRTQDSHELLGMYLYQWDGDAWVTNWLGVPAVALLVLLLSRWALVGSSLDPRRLLRRLPLKRRSELTPEEEGALGGYGVLLIPLGLALAGYGFVQADAPTVLGGLGLALSPFLLLIKIPRGK
jgi:hypothetical protein